MKKALYFTFLLAVAQSIQALAQEAAIFPLGEKAPNVHHVGGEGSNRLRV